MGEQLNILPNIEVVDLFCGIGGLSQWSAKPCTAVRIRQVPQRSSKGTPFFVIYYPVKQIYYYLRLDSSLCSK